MMHIAFNTDELTAEDKAVLALIATGQQTVATPSEGPAPAKEGDATTMAKPAKKAAPAKTPEPVAEVTPEPEEDLVGGDEPAAEPEGPTLSDAVAAATKLVSEGQSKKVKEALAVVGAQRVSNIEADQVAAFLAALAA